MTAYHTTEPRFQSAMVLRWPDISAAATRLVTRATAWLAMRHTRKALETLDAKMLADIGVPHYGTAPDAGALTRYPDLIRPSGAR